MNILVILLLPGALLTSKAFSSAAVINCVAQFVVFVVTAQVPAWITNRMSYVDIAWPYGLVTIGTLPWMATAEMFGPRTYMIMTAYLIAGGRMGLGATTFLFKGVLNNEFPRYLYLRKIWKDNHGIEEGSWSFKLSMQQEIFVQCLCNMGLLSTPMFLQAFGHFTGPLTTLEIMGWVLWLSSLVFEHVSDLQKKAFIRECSQKNIKNAICEVGLWRYSRHPNYFGEWMVWNSLVLTTLPSLFAFWSTSEELLMVKIGVTCGLALVSPMMYNCLTSYTGAIPAEHYSVQKRPEYADYQRRVNMFFPGPRIEKPE